MNQYQYGLKYFFYLFLVGYFEHKFLVFFHIWELAEMVTQSQVRDVAQAVVASGPVFLIDEEGRHGRLERPHLATIHLACLARGRNCRNEKTKLQLWVNLSGICRLKTAY